MRKWVSVGDRFEVIFSYKDCELLLEVGKDSRFPKAYFYAIYDSHDARRNKTILAQGIGISSEGAKAIAETQADMIADSGFISNR